MLPVQSVCSPNVNHSLPQKCSLQAHAYLCILVHTGAGQNLPKNTCCKNYGITCHWDLRCFSLILVNPIVHRSHLPTQSSENVSHCPHLLRDDSFHFHFENYFMNSSSTHLYCFTSIVQCFTIKQDWHIEGVCCWL